MTFNCFEARPLRRLARLSALLATAVTAGWLVAGCTIHVNAPPMGMHGPGGKQGMFRPDPVNPRVTVLRSKLVVDQEPIRIFKDQFKDNATVTISWRLPPNGEHVFTADGIVLKAENEKASPPAQAAFKCGLGANAREYTCQVLPTERGGRYKYTIKAKEERSGKELEALDPVVVNEW